MVNRLFRWSVPGFAIVLAAAVTTSAIDSVQAPSDTGRRFDELVRADFFAGMAGDAAALERAMRRIEEALAATPDAPEPLVWHGSGLLVRAEQAFKSGDTAAGETLRRRGLEEMETAIAKSPGNVAVLIPRGATLLAVSRSLPDAAQAKALLATGVADYEKVLALQAPYFRYLSEHARGELLFGLGEGLHRLGEHERARTQFERLLREAPGSQYQSMAAAWLKDPDGRSTRQAACVGCHHGR